MSTLNPQRYAHSKTRRFNLRACLKFRFSAVGWGLWFWSFCFRGFFKQPSTLNLLRRGSLLRSPLAGTDTAIPLRQQPRLTVWGCGFKASGNPGPPTKADSYRVDITVVESWQVAAEHHRVVQQENTVNERSSIICVREFF